MIRRQKSKVADRQTGTWSGTDTQVRRSTGRVDVEIYMNDRQAQRREVSIAMLYTRRALASRINTTRRRTIIYDRSSEGAGLWLPGLPEKNNSGLAWPGDCGQGMCMPSPSVRLETDCLEGWKRLVVEWSGVEWSGAEWSGVECSGVGWSVV